MNTPHFTPQSSQGSSKSGSFIRPDFQLHNSVTLPEYNPQFNHSGTMAEYLHKQSISSTFSNYSQNAISMPDMNPTLMHAVPAESGESMVLNHRDRAYTWPKKPPDFGEPPSVEDISPAETGSKNFEASHNHNQRRASEIQAFELARREDTQSNMSMDDNTIQRQHNYAPAAGRRNPWGYETYSTLLTRAIMSSPENRLTLAEIYEWMMKNVQYFGERSDASSSAGWKNSVRHNLSMLSRFVKVQNEEPGKSSWWTCRLEPDAQSSPVPHSPAPSLPAPPTYSQPSPKSPATSACSLDAQGSIESGLHKRRATVATSNHQVINARNRLRDKLTRTIADNNCGASEPMQLDTNHYPTGNGYPLKRVRSSQLDERNNGSPASPVDFKPNFTLMPNSFDAGRPTLRELLESSGVQSSTHVMRHPNVAKISEASMIDLDNLCEAMNSSASGGFACDVNAVIEHELRQDNNIFQPPPPAHQPQHQPQQHQPQQHQPQQHQPPQPQHHPHQHSPQQHQQQQQYIQQQQQQHLTYQQHQQHQQYIQQQQLHQQHQMQQLQIQQQQLQQQQLQQQSQSLPAHQQQQLQQQQLQLQQQMAYLRTQQYGPSVYQS